MSNGKTVSLVKICILLIRLLHHQLSRQYALPFLFLPETALMCDVRVKIDYVQDFDRFVYILFVF